MVISSSEAISQWWRRQHCTDLKQLIDLIFSIFLFLTKNVYFIDNPANVVCESLQVFGVPIAYGNYNLWMKQPFPDPKVSVEDIRLNSTKIIKLPVYKHTQKDLVIFYKDGGDGWRIGREASYKNGSYLFKSK